MRPIGKSYRTANQPRPKEHRTARNGFSLVELVLSMAVMTILLGGMSSAMMLASRALPDPASGAAAFREGCQLVEQIADELQTAQSFITKSAAIVGFTVPDRTGDLSAETIRYAWSGTPGQALQRLYNSGAVHEVVSDVHHFEVRYTNSLIDQVSKTTEVRIILQIGSDPAGRVELATRLLNEPVAN